MLYSRSDLLFISLPLKKKKISQNIDYLNPTSRWLYDEMEFVNCILC